jgi:hypothetical protein
MWDKVFEYELLTCRLFGQAQGCTRQISSSIVSIPSFGRRSCWKHCITHIAQFPNYCRTALIHTHTGIIKFKIEKSCKNWNNLNYLDRLDAVVPTSPNVCFLFTYILFCIWVSISIPNVSPDDVLCRLSHRPDRLSGDSVQIYAQITMILKLFSIWTEWTSIWPVQLHDITTISRGRNG